MLIQRAQMLRSGATGRLFKASPDIIRFVELPQFGALALLVQKSNLARIPSPTAAPYLPLLALWSFA